MVYCGKPSGGCYACRERKSRCDKLPEGCTQCKKAKRVCPGYRQLGDVIFHNESEKVVRKAKAKEAKSKAKREAADATKARSRLQTDPLTLDLDDPEVVQQSKELTARYQAKLADLILLPPLEELATGCFVSNFISRPEGESGPGRFDYIAPEYREYSMDEGLVASMRAVGFATHAHASHSSELMNKARVQYAQAIKATNLSLASTAAAKKDTTLLSILVLGIFETITGTQRRSLKDWSQHINGAAAVITLRGADQIKTMPGRRMLFQVTSNLLITCLAMGRPLPKLIRKYCEEAIARIENPDPALKVQTAMMEVAQLRADVQAGTITDPQVVLNTALDLDYNLLTLSSNPPDEWTYETIYTDIETTYVWRGRYHVYADCWIAQMWNALRTVRVIVNELIRDTLLRGFAAKPPLFPLAIHTAQFQLSTDTLYELQADILASVPQHLFALPSPAEIRASNQAQPLDPLFHAPPPTSTSPSVEPLHQSSSKGKEREQTPPLSASFTFTQPAVDSNISLPHRPPSSSTAFPPISSPSPSATSTTSKSTSSPQPSSSKDPYTQTEPQSHTHPPSTSSKSQSQSQTPQPSTTTSSSSLPTQIPPPPSSSHFKNPIRHPLLPAHTSGFSHARKSTAAARTYGGNFLMWPLWFAGVMDVATDEVRTFVIRNLRDVGESLGIRQGWVLAEMIEQGTSSRMELV